MQRRLGQLPSEAIDLRLMSEADLVGADELRGVVGWNQTQQDWRRLLALQPQGCFVAFCNGALVGTVTTTAYGTDLAWIGMMLVHPEHRRKGIGKRLMNRALEHLKELRVRCVKLDATPAGRPLYEQLGFVAESTLQRWQRAVVDEILAKSMISEQTRELRVENWPRVEAIDAAGLGARRPQLLRLLAEGSRRALVWPATGQVLGFGFVRSGANSDYLGPLACTRDDGLAALVSSLMDGTEPSVTWDIPDANEPAKSAAGRYGFGPVRPLTRMRLGPRLDPTQPHTLFGIADPAVG